MHTLNKKFYKKNCLPSWNKMKPWSLGGCEVNYNHQVNRYGHNIQNFTRIGKRKLEIGTHVTPFIKHWQNKLRRPLHTKFILTDFRNLNVTVFRTIEPICLTYAHPLNTFEEVGLIHPKAAKWHDGLSQIVLSSS